MTKQPKHTGGARKEVRAWGIKRTDVDINQLALAYYLLARMRIEQQRRETAVEDSAATSDERAA